MNVNIELEKAVDNLIECRHKWVEAVVQQERERIAQELKQLAYTRADGNHTLHEYDVADYAIRLEK